VTCCCHEKLIVVVVAAVADHEDLQRKYDQNQKQVSFLTNTDWHQRLKILGTN